MLVPLLLAHESPRFRSRMQAKLLGNVFRYCTDDFRNAIDFDSLIREVDYVIPHQIPVTQCKLHFQDGTLHEFFIANWALTRELCIKFLPPSVESLRIESTSLQCPLETRTLPRNSKDVFLKQCRLVGSLDLMYLPPKVEDFNVRINRLDGQIWLTHLPETLKILDLRGNTFNQDVVYYRELPESVREILLENTSIQKATSLTGFNARDVLKIRFTEKEKLSKTRDFFEYGEFDW